MKGIINHKRTNRESGKKFMLVVGDNDKGLVMVLESNYRQGSDHVRWVICSSVKGQSHFDFQSMATIGMNLSEAIKLMNKKVGRKCFS